MSHVGVGLLHLGLSGKGGEFPEKVDKLISNELPFTFVFHLVFFALFYESLAHVLYRT